MKGDLTCMYLNQTEDQCSTQKGLELFRQVITRYEEGNKSEPQEDEDDDDEFTSSTVTKRQKLSTTQQLAFDMLNTRA